MSWANSRKDNADAASKEFVAWHPGTSPTDAPTPWEPHEIWRTRVKEPRASAERLREEARAAASEEQEPS